MSVDQNLEREALALLRARGYICLTADEAEKVRVGLLNPTARPTRTAGDILPTFRSEALALLSPAGKDET